jgi:hypothetical protein
MATQKPIQPLFAPYTWANSVNVLDPSSPEYKEIVERPPVDKIASGWLFGEKPSHKYWNWGWKKMDDYSHHINQFGVPEWDNQTEYEIGSIVLMMPYLYRATAENQDDNPEDLNSWELLGQLLENLDDTEITTPSDPTIPQILSYDDTAGGGNGAWINEDLQPILDNTALNNLYDVNISGQQIDEVLAYSEELETWTNQNIRTIVQNEKNSELTSIQNINSSQLIPGNILKYENQIWKTNENIQKTGSWDKVIDKPNEYQPPFSSENHLGGAKIYASGDTLHIKNIPTAKPFPPENLKSISETTQVQLYWLPGKLSELSYYYNIYRDKLDLQKGVVDNVFIDDEVEKDREYSYYVTGVNQHGESDASYPVIGHTFSEPSAPRNLSYTLTVRDVNLMWEVPEEISGNLEYEIYENGNILDTTFNTSYTQTNASVGVHTYFIIAKNKYFMSNNSNTINVLVQ